ncbi:EcsC family protein [Micromonospora okii]|uniref:EcsC family protein n=1 Tax=Micromonospora okii TaxID=1182970 RepID=UPI001E3113EB|nr:EcsC family protein [Micromonospora okii]
MLFQPPDSGQPTPRAVPGRAKKSESAVGEQPEDVTGGRDEPHAGAEPGPGGPETTGPAATPGTPATEPETDVTAAEPAARARAPRKATARKAAPGRATPAKSAAKATPVEATAEAAPAKVTAKAARKKAAPARTAAEPAPTTPAAGVVAVPEAAGPVARTAGVGLRATAARVLDQPGFAPELLALAAVRTLGPDAREWARRHRAAYPEATADGLARLATRRYVRLARAGGATAALAGAFAPVAELAAALWAQAGLVLHLAAAYGRDPADPERAVELLVLTGVHPDQADARAALAAAEAAAGAVDQPWPRVVEGARRLAAPLGAWLGVRWAARLVPGAAVLAGAAGGSAAAERLAARAVATYRPPRRGR